MKRAVLAIRQPTTMSAGPVAYVGMLENSGAKKQAPRKKQPVRSVVRPVRPPCSTATDDSAATISGLRVRAIKG